MAASNGPHVITPEGLKSPEDLHRDYVLDHDIDCPHCGAGLNNGPEDYRCWHNNGDGTQCQGIPAEVWCYNCGWAACDKHVTDATI